MKNNLIYMEMLTATISHEMLTPLNSILNLSRMIKDSKPLRTSNNINRPSTFSNTSNNPT